LTVAAEIEEIDAEEVDMAEGLPNAPQVGVTDQEVTDLVAFMKSLTDPRVACRRGDFDHPQLVIAHGHVDNPSKTAGNATDYWDAILPTTGRDGGPCFQNTGDGSPFCFGVSHCSETARHCQNLPNRLPCQHEHDEHFPARVPEVLRGRAGWPARLWHQQ